jgi:hypothetical protein
MFDEITLKTKFLLGKPIELDGIGKLHQLTLDEILDIGFPKYNSFLGVLCISKEEILEELKIEDQDFEPFDFIVANCIHSEEYKELVCKALSAFLKSDVTFNQEGYFEIGELIDCRILHKQNFNFFIDIVKQQNCIREKPKLPECKNEAQRQYYEKLKEVRAKKEQFENKNSFYDIVSSLCSRHNSINVFNIGDFNIYQIIDQYKRLVMIDEYFISVDSRMHGASEDVTVTHWSDKAINE